MKRKIKKLLLVALATTLGVTQFSVFCQAKLKPGQLNKEALKWLEPYKERPYLVSDWTDLDEYDPDEAGKGLQNGAVISNQNLNPQNDIFYDHYWDKKIICGGLTKIFHKRNIAFTKPILGFSQYEIDKGESIVLEHKNGRIIEGDFLEDSTRGRELVRVVKKDVQSFFGKRTLAMAVKVRIDQTEAHINKIVLLCDTELENPSSKKFLKYYGIDVKKEYKLNFDDIKESSLEKAIDKFAKVSYNYYMDLGVGYETNYFINKELEIAGFTNRKPYKESKYVENLKKKDVILGYSIEALERFNYAISEVN